MKKIKKFNNYQHNWKSPNNTLLNSNQNIIMKKKSLKIQIMKKNI